MSVGERLRLLDHVQLQAAAQAAVVAGVGDQQVMASIEAKAAMSSQSVLATPAMSNVASAAAALIA